MNPTSPHARRAVGRAAATAVLAAALVITSAPADATAPPSAVATADKPVEYSDGVPRHARLTIPGLPRITSLRVVAYRGKTDDGPGTRTQNRGIAAAPYGPQGGIGPGGIGNYQVTAHRTSHGGIFRRTPTLRNGDKVYVDAGPWRYVYEVFKTRWVSFRSAKSLRAQRAPVPGKPGKTPTRGYITISTCATPEDHAAGNYWTDQYGNPEHRIDKIGILVKRVKRPPRT
jgi:sortase A